MTVRYLAQLIVDSDGSRHPLSLLELSDDGYYHISAFSAETASTSYVDGVIVVGCKKYEEFIKKRKLSESPEIWLCSLVKKS
ncbi:MAG: hypothetical protein K2L80_06625 [Muribaculaceae bacterium]|nr:hypothetical protein [Muribaculaceae bacterium]MDE6332261.1 hypothetical protein [Muribaculaceae bacterium]